MRYSRFLLVFALLLLARSAWATCSGVCVQESTVATATSGAAPNPTLGVNTTAGHALLAAITTASGNSTLTISGQGATWTVLYNTGNSTSTGMRTAVWCGIVVTPATTVTFAGMGTNSAGYLQETNKKGCNIANATGVANVGFAASGTSISSFSIATLTSSAVMFATGSHRTAEAVTDNNSLTKTNTSSAIAATFSGDYGTPNSSESFAYSWTTSSANSWGAVAFDDQCTGNDACLQMAPGVHSSGAANLVITFPSTVSVGQTVIVQATQGIGNGSISVAAASGTDVYANGWKLVGDSGNAGAGGERTFTYCGIASVSGTTVTMTVSGAGGTGFGIAASGYICNVDQSAVYNSSSSTVSSTTIPSITTTVANDLIIGGASHGHAEAQTDGSTGFRPIIPYSTTSPAISMNYEVASGTGTFSVSWSWTTAAIAAGEIIALEPGSSPSNNQVSILRRIVPVSISTPTPPVTPNLGGFYKGTQEANERCPVNLTAFGNAAGCSVFFKWAQLEPQNGIYDWYPIQFVLANSTGASSPANYPVQVEILVGDGGVPTTQVVCNSYTPPTSEPGPITPCTPWLAGIAGIPTHWRAGAVSNKSLGGILACQPTFNPAPWDTTYQSALATFEAAFDAQFKNTNIKLVSLNVAGPDGHNMGLDIQIASQTCPDWSATNYYTTNTLINPLSNNPGKYNFNETVSSCAQGAVQPATWDQTPGHTVTDGTCSWTNTGIAGTYTETYSGASSPWATLAAGQGATTEAQWVTLVTGAVDTMIAAQATAIPDIITSYWVQASNWPAITGAAGSNDPDTAPDCATGLTPCGIKQTWLNYAQNHQSVAGYYVINEALGNNGFTASILNQWISSPNNAKAGSQMVKALSAGGICTSLCGALITCGGCQSIGFSQVYQPDIANCPTTISDYNSVVAGDPGHLCAAAGACTGNPICNF